MSDFWQKKVAIWGKKSSQLQLNCRQSGVKKGRHSTARTHASRAKSTLFVSLPVLRIALQADVQDVFFFKRGKILKDKTVVSDRARAFIGSSFRAFRTREIVSREIVSKVNASESAIKKALHTLTVEGNIHKVRHGLYVRSTILKRMYEESR